MTDLFYAETNSYSGLRRAIAARVEQLNISRECLDEVAHLTRGHAGKLLSPSEVKRFGMITLEQTLRAVGLRLIVVDDRDALAKAEPDFWQRSRNQARLNNDSRKSKGRHTPKKVASSRATKPPRPKRGKPYLSN